MNFFNLYDGIYGSHVLINRWNVRHEPSILSINYLSRVIQETEKLLTCDVIHVLHQFPTSGRLLEKHLLRLRVRCLPKTINLCSKLIFYGVGNIRLSKGFINVYISPFVIRYCLNCCAAMRYKVDVRSNAQYGISQKRELLEWCFDGDRYNAIAHFVGSDKCKVFQPYVDIMLIVFFT